MARTTVKKDEGASGKAGGGDKPPRKPNPGVKGRTPPPSKGSEDSAQERAANWWEEFQKYLKNVQAEAKRVSWPTREQLKAYTLVVLFTLLVVTLYLFLCDLMFSHLFAWLISLISAHPKS